MDFSRINKVGLLTEFLPVKRLAELTPEKEYIVTDIKRVQTKWGSRITVDVEGEFTCFLPTRFVKLFEEDDALFHQMTAVAHANNLILRYYGGKFNSMEFKEAQK